MAELPRILAFLFLCATLGMLGMVALKVLARIVREAYRRVRSRRDLRKLRAYERGFRSADEYERLWEDS